VGRDAALDVEATLALLLLRSTGARELPSSSPSPSTEPTVDLRRFKSGADEERRGAASPMTSSTDMTTIGGDGDVESGVTRLVNTLTWLTCDF
jgi:hypothetical protein